MYNKTRFQRTSIKVNTSYLGETIEEKVNRITNNREPITDGAPLIYTDRKDGVQPAYDIRTDRFEVAVEAMDKVTKSMRAKREAKVVPLNQDKPGEPGKETENKSETGGQPTQGTSEK